jgi:hypothetical protein
MQSYWLIQRQTHEQQSFDQSTTISLLKVAEKMATLYKLTLPSGDFIKRITSNYYIVNYNNEIDAMFSNTSCCRNSDRMPITPTLNMPFMIARVTGWYMEIIAILSTRRKG